MISVDIACDLMDEDETGYVWTFLRDARDPSLMEPGAIVVAGDPDAPAVAEVVDIVDRSGRPSVRAAGSDRGLQGARPPGDHARLTLRSAPRISTRRSVLIRGDRRWTAPILGSRLGHVEVTPTVRRS
ncbi:MAG: hypothetical protein ACRD03_06690 [Acidimicrobiales bacterium]